MSTRFDAIVIGTGQAGPSLATRGDAAVHCVIDVMMADAQYTTLRNSVHIHPTVAELIPTLLGG